MSSFLTAAPPSAFRTLAASVMMSCISDMPCMYSISHAMACIAKIHHLLLQQVALFAPTGAARRCLQQIQAVAYLHRATVQGIHVACGPSQRAASVGFKGAKSQEFGLALHLDPASPCTAQRFNFATLRLQAATGSRVNL